MKDCEKYHGLLVGLMDQELSPEETSEVNEHLVRCANCRQEYEQLRETSGKLDAVSFVEPEDEALRKLWRSPFTRLSKVAGLILIIGGYLALIGFALYEFLASGKEAMWAKVSIAAIVIGFFILLFQVIRERLRAYKKDPYKEIQR